MGTLFGWIFTAAVVCAAYGWAIRRWGNHIRPGSRLHKTAMQFADWVDLDVAQKRRQPFDASGGWNSR